MSQAAEEAPLSELCTICHIKIPKYRCPRCSVRTCSLPCTQKHKKWSQCSGIRDPTAYLRLNELRTPSAFDRDFNFITSIERSLERAERETEDRGISLDHGYACALDQKAAGRKRKHPSEMVKGEAGFLRGAEASGVKVLRAPRGLSRNKQNCSRWHTKHKCLTWTVEWIAPSGERLFRNCLETTILSEAYDRVFPVPKGKRRAKSPVEEQLLPSIADTEKKGADQVPGHTSPEVQSPGEYHQQEAGEGALPPLVTTSENISSTSSTSRNSQSHRNVFYYLHRPRTGTRQTVLTPVPPTFTLKSALHNRTVIEFPTIYILPKSPQELFAGLDDVFILDDVYLRDREPGAEETDDYTSSEGTEDSVVSDDDDDDDDDDDGDVKKKESEDEDLQSMTASRAAPSTVPDLGAGTNIRDVVKQPTLSIISS